MPSQPASLTQRELAEIKRANESDRQPVVFVHGLWLLASSWDGWREMFEAEGYTTIAPGWPDDPETVAEGRLNPAAFAGKSVGAITNHYVEAIKQLKLKPVVIGHSFGGLITQKLAGLGIAAASIPIDPGPIRGVLPLPFSALKAASPVIAHPANRRRSVMLTFKQWRYAFTNAVEESEAKRLYELYPVAGSGIPLFQAAFANVNPRSEAKANTRNPNRGPMRIISGAKDHTVPLSMARSTYKRQRHNKSLTELKEIPGMGHSLVIDSGWRQVADVALEFVKAHVQA